MAMDHRLRHAMEELFVNTEARVVTAFKVIKCNPSTTSAWTKKKLPKSTGKERVVCLTAERRAKRRGFKGSFHSCKTSGGRYQIRKTWTLKHLTRIEAFPGADEGGQQYLELWFSNSAFTSETKQAFQVQDQAALTEVIGTLYLFVKKHERKLPMVVGYDLAQLDEWVAAQSDKAGIGAFGATLLGSEDGPGTGEADAGGAGSLVSAKEERDLQTLLEMFAMGVGDVEEFQERLQAELAALEAANVHAILESGPMVERVMKRMDDAISLIDDLNENLHIFDIKLRHMREDIAAIEARNNRLELQTRNNSKLLGALEGLLQRLMLPDATERALVQADFTEHNLATMVQAGWELHEHLESLADEGAAPSPGPAPSGSPSRGLSEGLASMSAVVEQRARLQALSRAYVDRASRFIAGELSRMSDATLTRINGLAGRDRLQLPDHWEIRDQAELLGPAMQVVKALRPACLGPLSDKYCQSVSTLIRKELRSYATEMRKAVQAGMAASPPEPDILRGYKKEDLGKALARNSMAPSDSGTDSPARYNSSNSAGRGKYGGGMLSPHTGFHQFLDVFVPFLVDEAKLAAQFLLLYRQPSVADEPPPDTPTSEGPSRDASSPAGQDAMARSSEARLGPEAMRVINSLLEGIGADFQAMVDLVSKSHQLLCIPMLHSSLAWRRQAEAEAEAAPLIAILNDCCQRLLAHFERYVLDMVLAITRYDGKGTISVSDSVKGQHVLPFLPNFVLITQRLEDLISNLASTPHSVQGAAQHGVRRSTGGSTAASEDMEDLRADSVVMHRLQGLDDDDDDDDVNDEDEDAGSTHRSSGRPARRELNPRSPASNAGGSRHRSSATPADHPDRAAGASGRTAAAPKRITSDADIPQHMPYASQVASVRDAVDPAHAVVVRAIFAGIERVAGADLKHGDRLRLENYAYFEDSMRQVASRVPVLDWFVRQAQEAKERAMQVYVQQQLEYGKFWRLLEFSQRVDELLAEVGPEEVPFQLHYQAPDLRSLLAGAMTHPEKRLAAMFGRCQKHMGASSPGLVAQVWQRCQAVLLAQYRRLEEQVALCYTSVQLSISPEELKELLKTIG
ncbi:hypothetical protein WJX72_011232 [[Myrmecia] bisecta]|uniref:Exocyst complex component Sec3 PIP2-binding N-terminal domain-containing protein n=1 Tax=[Myrmecia] bisecta TaxID=41462 RepID=A0AAW1PI88_9CHLO